MTDAELCDELAAVILTEWNAACVRQGVQASPFMSRLGEIFRLLRARGLDWRTILEKLGPIFLLLFNGADWEAILNAILALFFGPIP